MSSVERQRRRGVSIISSASVLRRFIWKHVELRRRQITRLRSPPISLLDWLSPVSETPTDELLVTVDRSSLQCTITITIKKEITRIQCTSIKDNYLCLSFMFSRVNDFRLGKKQQVQDSMGSIDITFTFTHLTDMLTERSVIRDRAIVWNVVELSAVTTSSWLNLSVDSNWKPVGWHGTFRLLDWHFVDDNTQRAGDWPAVLQIALGCNPSFSVFLNPPASLLQNFY